MGSINVKGCLNRRELSEPFLIAIRRNPLQSIAIHPIHHNPSQSFEILRSGRLAGIGFSIRLGIRMGITGLASDLNSHTSTNARIAIGSARTYWQHGA
jgi:hypothetical protein